MRKGDTVRDRKKLVWAGVLGVVLLLSAGAGRLGAPADAVTGAPATSHASVASASTPGWDCDPNDLPGGSEGPDDDGDECNFTITGSIPVPTPSSGLGEFAEGSPANAANCSAIKFAAAQVVAGGALTYIDAHDAPYAITWLEHFLNGTGTPLYAPNGGSLSRAVQADPQFIELNNTVQATAKGLLDGGELDVDVTPVLHTLNFSVSGTDIDLQLSFGGTQGIEVDGNGFPQNGRYIGQLTYTIEDVYGFYATGKFLGASSAMHYLQGTCGAPYYSGGAHWFYSSVIVTVPFNQPIG
jgi:hypothetical protein